MSEISGQVAAHEAYAFCCMRCGHGWEQAYDIEHHVDSSGRSFVVYKAEGLRVPSPLSSPSCEKCGGHIVRIMRSGQVSSARAPAMHVHTADKKKRGTKSVPAGVLTAGASAHHWSVFGFLNAFHHRKRGRGFPRV